MVSKICLHTRRDRDRSCTKRRSFENALRKKRLGKEKRLEAKQKQYVLRAFDGLSWRKSNARDR
jgi:hypothetical protein